MVLFKRLTFILLFIVVTPVAAQEARNDITLFAVGDIMAGRFIYSIMKSRGEHYPFEKIAPLFNKGDIVFGNLESILSSNNEPPFLNDKPHNFFTSPTVAKTLRDSGFTLLNLANNHAMDYGPSAIFETRQSLGRAGIKTFGAGKDLDEASLPAIISVKGVRFAFLGYGVAHSQRVYAGPDSAGIAQLRLDHIYKDIKSVRSKVDFLIVSFHWGKEYAGFPSERQQRIAHQVIDSGADMVLGHHPHVLQGIEIYKDKLIAYSLGNFLFDQKGNGTDRSIILSCKFKGKALQDVEVIPVDRFKSYFPKLAEGRVKQDGLEKLRQISLPLNDNPVVLEKFGLPDKKEIARREP